MFSPPSKKSEETMKHQGWYLGNTAEYIDAESIPIPGNINSQENSMENNDWKMLE